MLHKSALTEFFLNIFLKVHNIQKPWLLLTIKMPKTLTWQQFRSTIQFYNTRNKTIVNFHFFEKNLKFSMDFRSCSVHTGTSAVLEECVAVLFPFSQPWTLVQDLFPGELLRKCKNVFFSYISNEMNENEPQSNSKTMFRWKNTHIQWYLYFRTSLHTKFSGYETSQRENIASSYERNFRMRKAKIQ